MTNLAASSVGTRFIQALETLETQRTVDVLAELFSDECEVSNLIAHEPFRGKEGARKFWEEYLHSFQNIRSRFTHRTEHDDHVTLEWVSEGNLRDGRPVRYAGVSLLELKDGKVKRFRAYYDSAALPVRKAA